VRVNVFPKIVIESSPEYDVAGAGAVPPVLLFPSYVNVYAPLGVGPGSGAALLVVETTLLTQQVSTTVAAVSFMNSVYKIEYLPP
jgi:hypothetical protein